jgi:hypothetical protein
MEEEMNDDENAQRDFSNYLFDNSTGKVTDITKNF